MQLVASGYNLFYADPMPKRSSRDQVLVDAGLRKPVFAIKYQKGRLTGDQRHKKPDGYFASVDYGCSEVFSSKTISDSYEYTTETNLEASMTDRAGIDYTYPAPGTGFYGESAVGPDGGLGFQGTGNMGLSFHGFVGAEGTLSSTQKKMRSENLFQESRIMMTSARCAAYVAGISMGDPPETDPEFKQAVLSAKNRKAWFQIFDEFGTHYLTSVKMGARFGSTMIFQKGQYDAMISNLQTVGLEAGPVFEVGLKLAVYTADFQGALYFKPDLKVPILKDVPISQQESSWTMKSHASSMIMQGVGPSMPAGMTGQWMEKVVRNPVPIRFEKLELCAHPGLDAAQGEQCVDALKNYCESWLRAKGAQCDNQEKRECQMDSDCKQGSVCREFTCRTVPICYVHLFSDTGFRGSQLTLDPVNAVENPAGKMMNLWNDNWADEVSSIKLGRGCEKIYAVDDDNSPDNVWFKTSQSSLPNDLDNDIREIKVHAKPVPGTPPFQEGHVKPPADVGDPPKLDFNPPADKAFVHAVQDDKSSVAGTKLLKFFPNIGKAMYGYNHYYGAPFSTKYAGTDPGFRSRAVWSVSYAKGTKGTEATWHRIPMADSPRYILIIASGDWKKHKVRDIFLSDKPKGTPCPSTPGVTTYSGFSPYWGDYAHTRCYQRQFSAPEGNLEASNIHEFGTLSKAKQALKFETSKLKSANWPRFIVKATGAEVSEIAAGSPGIIDGQNQDRGMKEGFDAFLSRTHKRQMMNQVDAYLKANPKTKALMDTPKTINVNVPDGWKVTRSKGHAFCEKDFKTDQVKDANSYEKLTKSSFGIPKTKLGYNEHSFNFGLSYEKQDLLKTSGQRREKMFATQGECATYYAQIEDLENNPPETEPSFKYLVDSAKAERDYWTVFDYHGLDFPDEVVFGARYGMTQSITQSSFEVYEESKETLNLDFGASTGMPIETPMDAALGGGGASLLVSADVSIGYDGTEKTAESVSKYFQERKTFSIGKQIRGSVQEWMNDTEGEPMPIKFSFVSICKHPAFKAKSAECNSARATYCEKHLKAMHGDLMCGETPKSECTWDIDCDSIGGAVMRCEGGSCQQRPNCDVTLYEQPHFKGRKSKLRTLYYKSNEPFKIHDMDDYSWRAKSISMSGGCAKLILMGRNKLEHESNKVLTHYESNSVKTFPSVTPPVYLAVYPKEYWTNADNGWLFAEGEEFTASPPPLLACPSGYSQLGQVGEQAPGCGTSGCMFVNDGKDCAAKCTADGTCGLFQYGGGVSSNCVLVGWSKAEAGAQTDHFPGVISCKKSEALGHPQDCFWKKHSGKFSAGYAGGVWYGGVGKYVGGDSSKFSLKEAMAQCALMKPPLCKAVTCSSAIVSLASCSLRASESLQTGSSGEFTYAPPPRACFQAGRAAFGEIEAGNKCWWTAHANVWSGGYAAGVSTKFSLEDGKAKCRQLGSRCIGVTCAKDGSCTVRASTPLRRSEVGETTYTYQCGEVMVQKPAPAPALLTTDCWTKHPGKQGGGQSYLPSKKFDFETAKSTCLLLPTCKSVFCIGDQCAVRDSDSLQPILNGDPNERVTYVPSPSCYGGCRWDEYPGQVASFERDARGRRRTNYKNFKWAAQKCAEMGFDKCQAVSCKPDGQCSMRTSEKLVPQTGYWSYKPRPDCMTPCSPDDSSRRRSSSLSCAKIKESNFCGYEEDKMHCQTTCFSNVPCFPRDA
jgi:hypothetical protein